MKSFLSFIFCLFTLNIFAISFNGHIYDMDTKKPIPNAEMFIFVKGVNTHVKAQSDSLGKYIIDLPDTWIEGEYNMRIQNEFYYTVNGIVLVKNGAIRDFYIKQIPSSSSIIDIPLEEADVPMPTSNLVFLIDVSKSMNQDGKIDMLKIALKKLASLLRNSDKVSIVTYSTVANVYMKTTPGDNLEKINTAIDDLKCYGITMGGLGLDLAFSVAKKNYIKDANNKVILVTDGQFTSTESKQYSSMEKLIKKMRSKKIALTVFSFGNLVERTKSNLRMLSEIGGGTYAHIDNEQLAIEEMVDEAKNLGVFTK
ncbi:MAG TPA: VWA domain-containing protein [Chitinophagales bacterium]|nr:VWA domain-containing protein [Chitinophagales bacterium]